VREPPSLRPPRDIGDCTPSWASSLASARTVAHGLANGNVIARAARPKGRLRVTVTGLNYIVNALSPSQNKRLAKAEIRSRYPHTRHAQKRPLAMSTPIKTAFRFRCPKCKSPRIESVRAHDSDGRLMSWMQCSRCDCCQDPATAQFEFMFNEEEERPGLGKAGRP
jgi:hypothetical protein